MRERLFVFGVERRFWTDEVVASDGFHHCFFVEVDRFVVSRQRKEPFGVLTQVDEGSRGVRVHDGVYGEFYFVFAVARRLDVRDERFHNVCVIVGEVEFEPEDVVDLFSDGGFKLGARPKGGDVDSRDDVERDGGFVEWDVGVEGGEDLKIVLDGDVF